ncbi:hypothetical protein Fmac_010572 [Flemingia macrophylla]|uniref:U-box domain-containing protein n=1 Tax=Flemingia macrophylla TaxID=520843 RepID=A0ABD1MJY5_9FABA
MRLKFIELRTVSLMLEIMVDSERSTCEKALGVFEWLCCCEEGRRLVGYAHEIKEKATQLLKWNEIPQFC